LYLLEVGLKMLRTNTMQKSGEPAKHRSVASEPNAMYQGGQAREEEPGKNYMQPLGMLASPKRFIGHSLIRPTNHGYGTVFMMLPFAQESLKAWRTFCLALITMVSPWHGSKAGRSAAL
jgi:hypothetical protein